MKKINQSFLKTINLKIFIIIAVFALSDKIFGQTNAEILRRAKTAFDNQKFDEAITDLSIVISREPANEEALTQRARAFIILKKVPEALADAEKVLAVNTKNTFALNVRGMAKGANKDYKGAFDDFTQAVTIDSAFFRSYYQRAIARMFLKESLANVLGDFDLAIKYSNEDLGIIQDAGKACLDKNGAYNVCAAYFSKIKTKKPDSAAGYLGYALSYLNAYKIIADKSIFKGEILENFRKAIELNPKDEVAPQSLASLLNKLDDFDGAIAALNQALAINPNNDVSYGLRGDNYRLKKDYDRAVSDFSKAIELNPKYYGAYKYRALAMREKGISQKYGYVDEKDKLFWQQVAADYRKADEIVKSNGVNNDDLEKFLKTIPPIKPEPWANDTQLAAQLYDAVEKNDTDTALNLIKSGANVNYTQGMYKTSVIYEAANKNNLAIVKALLEAGADPNLSVPLYHAVYHDNAEMIRLFIKYKADVNAKYNDSGDTVLIAAAAYSKDVNTIKILLEAGANKSIADENGTTALSMAERKGKVDIAILLGGSAESTAAAVRKKQEEDAAKEARKQVAQSTQATQSTGNQSDGRETERVRRAIAAYDRVHEQVEANIKNYVDAQNKLNKGGDAAFLMKGTQARAYRALESAASAIEELLDRHGKYLPKELIEHILEDYSHTNGTRNFDWLLN